MANFVEQAILRLDDQTSGPAKTINTSLRRLYNTARQLYGLSGKRLNLGGNVRQINATIKQLDKLAAATKRMPRLVIRVDSSQVQRANVRLATMQQLMRQSGRAMMVPGASVPQVPRGGGGGAGYGGRYGGANAGFPTLLRNVALTSAAFYAVHTAASLASDALRSLADNATKRDRTALQSNVQASKEQRDIFTRLGGENAPAGAGPITFTANERRAFWASILGDVQGNASERATSAARITSKLESDLLPRLFAAQPDRSREEVLSGFKQVVKALNLASTDLVDTSGNFTKSGQRAFEGIQLAFAANSDLDPNQVRTTLANLKTSALSLSPRELASVLISAADRGVRSANETFRAQVSATGTVDNKALNNALAAAGLLKGVERNAKGNVIAGSGRAVDQELLQVAPREWFNKHFRPVVEKALKDQGREINDSNIISESARLLPGMSSAGRQAVADFLTGAEQMKAALDQASLALQQSVPEAVAKSWAAQGESVAIAWKDAMGRVGDTIAQSIGLADIFKNLASTIRGDNGTGAQAGLALGALGLGGGAGVLGARIALGPLFAAGPALTTSAGLLDGAAAALTRAAIAQGGSGVATGAGGAAAGAAGGFLRGAMRWMGWVGVAAIAAELAYKLYNGDVKTDKMLSKPGDAKAQPGEVESLKAELAKLNTEISRQKSMEKIPGTADAATAGLQNQANLITERLNVIMSEKNSEFATTFETGATSLKGVGPVIDTAAAAFGPAAGAGILGFANQFGAVAGAAIAAAANNLSINLKTPGPAANTGTSKPSE